MRILHLLASADRRGAEVFGTQLAAQLDQLGHQSEVIALTGSSATSHLDVEVIAALGSISAARTLRRRAADVDIVLGHGSRALVGGTIATFATKTPLVYRSIGDPTYWGASWARRARTGLQLRRTAAVTALWPAAGEAIASQYRVPESRIRIVPNAVDDHGFAPATPETTASARTALGVSPTGPVVLYLGALSSEKRVDRVIDAVALVPGAYLMIAGDGPDRASVEAQAARALPGRHRVLGSVDDVIPLFAAADCAILLSATEGQPGVAIEAGLSGVPLVATDVGGVSSVVVHQQTGWLVPGDPTPTDAAAALEAVLGDRTTLGQQARQRCVEQFTFATVARQFDDVLRSAAGHPRTDG